MLSRPVRSALNKTLTEALLALEKAPSSAEDLESMMRAAHSIKGAARMVGVDAAVRVAHVMEDVFVAAQKGELDLLEWHIDTLLKGVDMLGQIGAQDDAVLISWQHDNANEVAALESQLQRLLDPDAEPPAAPAVEQLAPVETDAERSALITAESDSATSERSASPAADKPSAKKSSDSSLRVTASVLNRLMGYAGEAQVEAGNLRPADRHGERSEGG
ncbi:Hpt domain-containing protein [Candidatus Reidiella endopervernicosa]|uniref:Hpt domain-containing protein n=2 Tax=Candidatus Reidiella endopervernicosa TaxID=2738883 RepID=A0A6N0I0R6_9GAMM|nr:Hpt domain-containing protein [Candidatus Reidiella endopervernicosa]